MPSTLKILNVTGALVCALMLFTMIPYSYQLAMRVEPGNIAALWNETRYTLLVALVMTGYVLAIPIRTRKFAATVNAFSVVLTAFFLIGAGFGLDALVVVAALAALAGANAWYCRRFRHSR